MKLVILVLGLALAACGASRPGEPPPRGACIKTGCGGSVCALPGNVPVTSCGVKPQYACYEAATCERQPDGKCGWTQTAELSACLSHPPVR